MISPWEQIVRQYKAATFWQNLRANLYLKQFHKNKSKILGVFDDHILVSATKYR